MEDHQIVSCGNKNLAAYAKVEEILEDLFEIPNVDPRLIGFINEYFHDLAASTTREVLLAEKRQIDLRLKSL